MTRLQTPPNPAAAMWIEGELSQEVGAVTNVVPSRFAAYARIFHPASTSTGRLTSWSEVATKTGRTMHALAQWHSIAGAGDPDDASKERWSGEAPERGDFPSDALCAISTILAAHTTRADSCFFGLWTGWSSMTLRSRQGAASAVAMWPAEFRSGDDVAGAHFGLPPQSGRDYLLLHGPLSGIAEIQLPAEQGGLGWPTSPNLMWPEDRAWFLASDIDFDSTLVGGTDSLIGEIVGSSALEAWEVRAADSLTFDADELNG